MKRKILAILAAAIICLAPLSSLAAYQSTTLRHGMRGEEVAQIQQALISLGYLKGTADGVFGNNTENAVRKFQRKNKLTADGLVGTKTKELLLSKASGSSAPSESASSSSGNDSAAASAGNASAARGSGNASSGSSLFSGNYATIKSGSRGARVRTLQNALIALNYLSGNADGSYGKKTKAAVIAFQQGNNLKADGAAGKKTLAALEKAYQNGEKASSSPASDPAPAAPPAPEQIPVQLTRRSLHRALCSCSAGMTLSSLPSAAVLTCWFTTRLPAFPGRCGSSPAAGTVMQSH